MRKVAKTDLQGALFEDDYLLRTLGAIARNPDVALTELVANSRDAGATRVRVQLPDEHGGTLVVEDDGVGMTPDQFRERWMTLGYNREKHQGVWVEWPDGHKATKRRAFGRNGVGRHGLLCFADSYVVDTRRRGTRSIFEISTTERSSPFSVVREYFEKATGHGTKLSATVSRNLPSAERVRQVLAGRFLHDPELQVTVNGSTVPLTDLTGFIAEGTLEIMDGLTVRALIFDTQTSARLVAYQGIAFWVSGKLVGTPSWILGDRAVLDGRTRAGRRFSVVIQCPDEFAELVEADWLSFKKQPLRDALWSAVSEYVTSEFASLMKERASEASVEALREHRERIRDLPRSAAMEVVGFAEELTATDPNISPDTLSVAIKAVINLEKSRHGTLLLEKLALLPDEDVEALDRLLSEWSARDALTVLDEIDARLKVIEAIDRLEADPSIDELRSLHPLVTQARWLFGPEFDSPELASNLSLRNAVATVFKVDVTDNAFLNHKRRPDLVVLADATLSLVATEQIDPSNGLSQLGDVLLIELKRGRSTIGREEMNQADGYVQDLLQCGHLDGPPFIRAFVVGHKIGGRTEATKSVGDGPKARISAITFAQLTRTASQRLFRLRDRLSQRYEELSGEKLLEQVLSTPSQLTLDSQPAVAREAWE